MGQIAKFLVQKKFEKAKDHQEEVAGLEVEVAEAWDKYQTNIHARAAASAAASPAATRRTPPVQDSESVKLVSELKPDTLSHDSSAGGLRIWCRKYEAYYHASNMQLARNQVQQAYLLNCLDSELYLRLTSSIAATTPVLGAGNSCLNMLRQKYPLLLRRKTAAIRPGRTRFRRAPEGGSCQSRHTRHESRGRSLPRHYLWPERFSPARGAQRAGESDHASFFCDRRGSHARESHSWRYSYSSHRFCCLR